MLLRCTASARRPRKNSHCRTWRERKCKCLLLKRRMRVYDMHNRELLVEVVGHPRCPKRRWKSFPPMQQHRCHTINPERRAAPTSKKLFLRGVPRLADGGVRWGLPQRGGLFGRLHFVVAKQAFVNLTFVEEGNFFVCKFEQAQALGARAKRRL